MGRGTGWAFEAPGVERTNTRSSIASPLSSEGAHSDEVPLQQNRWLMSQQTGSPDSFDHDEHGSLNDVASADVRRSIAHGPQKSSKRESLSEGARLAGWTLHRPAHIAKTVSPTLLLQDQNVLQDLSNLMVEQLSKMYAHCEVVLDKQRARHSSDLSLMLRKVDKDLKDTYRSVRETFVSLTQQVKNLLREVQHGRNEVASIQEKFNVAISMAEVRAQYVEELEAVLDGKSPGASEAMRKLTDENLATKKALDETVAEHEAREQALSEEIKFLRTQLNRLKVERSVCDGAQPPLLPEMMASWTRRVVPNSSEATPVPSAGDESATGSASPRLASHSRCVSRSSGVRTPGVDIVGSTLRCSDETRAVSRSKSVRTPSGRSSELTSPALVKRAAARQARKETNVNEELQRRRQIKELHEKMRQNEQRAKRQHEITELAFHGLKLLRDVFNELRQHWRIRFETDAQDLEPGKVRMLLPPAGSTGGALSEEDKQARKAGELLDRIVKLFYEAMPKIGNFQDLFAMLGEEIGKPFHAEDKQDLKKEESGIALPERMPLDPGQFVFGAPRSRRAGGAGAVFNVKSETDVEANESTLSELGQPVGGMRSSRRLVAPFLPMPEEGDEDTNTCEAATKEGIAPLQRHLVSDLTEGALPEGVLNAGPTLGMPHSRLGPLSTNLANMPIRSQSPVSGKRLTPRLSEDLSGLELPRSITPM